MFTIIGGDGKEYGPATTDQIRAWISGGRANLETKARAVGAEEWRRLGDYPEFGGAAAVPPPMDAPAAPAAPVFTAPVSVPSSTSPELAGRGIRLGAAIIDRLLATIVAVPGIAVMGPAFAQILLAAMRGEEPDLEMINAGTFVIGAMLAGFGLLVLFIVQVWMLSTRGQSIGKRILGIRIVKFADNSNPGFLHAWLLRNFVPGIISIVPYIGFLFVIVDLCFIFSEQRRCVHDHIASTKVVKV